MDAIFGFAPTCTEEFKEMVINHSRGFSWMEIGGGFDKLSKIYQVAYTNLSEFKIFEKIEKLQTIKGCLIELSVRTREGICEIIIKEARNEPT